MIGQFFLIHYYLDRNGSLRDPSEARCEQCNLLLANAADLTQHVRVVHTYAARRGTRAHSLADAVVKRRFQESLPKVQLRGGVEIRNVYKKKWVGMTFTADGGQDDHVRERLSWAGTEFGRQREMLCYSCPTKSQLTRARF